MKLRQMLGGLALSLPVAAMAALPAEVDTAVTAITTDGTAMVGKGYIIAGAVAVALAVFGLFKKVLRKAAS